MKRLTVKPTWVVENEEGAQLGPELFTMLDALHQSGKLTEAAAMVGLSYRHSWNLLETWNAFFGLPLARLERGKGATLTPLGEKLLHAEQRVNARIGLQLESLASELNLELNKLLAAESSTIRIHASHGFAVARLPELFKENTRIQLDLRYLGTQESLSSLSRGDCDLAGFHIPVGRLGARALAQIARWLHPDQQRLIHLVTRTQGLFVAKGNPKNIRGIADLARPDVIFINRQKGSGTRLLLDQLMQEAGIDSHAVHGFGNEEFTHAAVAAYVASGTADAAFGVEPAAHQFRLDFIPVAKERYFLIALVRSLDRPEVSELLSLIGSKRFLDMVALLPGYSAPRAGQVTRIDKEFPALADGVRRASE